MCDISGNAASAVANQHGRRRRRTLHGLHYRSRATVGRPSGHDIATTPSPFVRSQTPDCLDSCNSNGRRNRRPGSPAATHSLVLRIASAARASVDSPPSLVWRLPCIPAFSWDSP